MKKFIVTIAVALMSASTVFAQRIANINVEASFITDKMIAELGLSNAWRNSILQININYLNSINSYSDITSNGWKKRNKCLKKMLSAKQWKRYKEANYFYRPIGWNNGAYIHNIYVKYPRQPERRQFMGPPTDRRYGTPSPPRDPQRPNKDLKRGKDKKKGKENKLKGWERYPGRR